MSNTDQNEHDCVSGSDHIHKASRLVSGEQPSLCCRWQKWTLGLFLMSSIATLLFIHMTPASLQTWDHDPGPAHRLKGASAHVIDLGGSGWTLRSQNGSISIPATVPSQQYIDLLHAGVIEDPLFGLNNNDVWVRDQNWTYSRTLSGLKNSSHNLTMSTRLVFDGLDTYATITLCGNHVANTANMHRQYIFDVSDILRSCNASSELSINFGPAVAITHQLSKGPSGNELVNNALRPFGLACNDDPGSELECRSYARKEQNDFGWDWSPALAPAGPWRSVYAVHMASDQVYINNILIDIYRKGQMNNIPPDESQPWVFNASIDFVGTVPRGAEMQLTLSDTNGKLITQQPLTGVDSSANTITGSTIIDPGHVQQWWPNGMGSQPLYHAKVDITAGQGQNSGYGPDRGRSKSSVASVERRVGFRTIVINLGEITDEQIALGIQPGANWHFEINGHEFFAKGSNLVPPDVFWPRANESDIRNLLTLAKNANMNMLRVWSSGVYLEDWIYDMADEMGLLLWSEFQFTTAFYPADDYYLKEYEAEAYFNIRRINHHPSLALWAGGNELELLLISLDLSIRNTTLFENYQRVQEELLVKCVSANTKSISYIPSSTYHGYKSLNFDSIRPMNSRYNTGDREGLYANTDYYNYDASSLFTMITYPIGRFANEFGFISMPSVQTWDLAVSPEELYYPSNTVINHNRHFGNIDESKVSDTTYHKSLAGIDHMTKAVEMYLPIPNRQDSRANFSAWCYSTQIIQADAMAHQIAFYRRGSGLPQRTLGSLYWQLNDLWAAPTWASIETTGRQKLLYYVGEEMFSPVIVYPYWTNYESDLQIWITSDLFDSISGILEYQWVDWSGNPLSVGGSVIMGGHENETQAVTYSNTLPFTVGAINSTQVLRYPNLQSAFAESGGLTLSNAVLLLSVTAGSHKHTSAFHPVALKEVSLPDPRLTLTHSGNSFTVTATKAVAAWVWLDYDTNDVQGYWSENSFWLNKGESKTVTFTVMSDLTRGRWTETVGVRSIYDNTQP